MPFASEDQRMKAKGYHNEDLVDDDTPMPDNFAKRDSQGAYLRNGDGWDFGSGDNASEI